VQKPAAAQPGSDSGQALSGKRGRKAGPLPKTAGLSRTSLRGIGDASSYGTDHATADSRAPVAGSVCDLRAGEPLDQPLLPTLPTSKATARVGEGFRFLRFYVIANTFSAQTEVLATLRPYTQYGGTVGVAGPAMLDAISRLGAAAVATGAGAAVFVSPSSGNEVSECVAHDTGFAIRQR
jgi:hypothetical protein